MRTLIVLVATLAAAPALAQEISDLDADGDGLVTYEEMVAVAPTATQESYAAIDTNTDGLVDEAELAAAVEAGLIGPNQG